MKKFYISYINNNKHAILLKEKYKKLFNDDDNNNYKEYIKICQYFEEKGKMHKGDQCIDFWIFFDYQQSKVFSSSVYCEPLGSIINPLCNAQCNHETIEDKFIISSHSSSSKTCLNKLCYFFF